MIPTRLTKRLFKTDLLYTAAEEPIKNGMVAINEENEIIAVGDNLSFDGLTIEYYRGSLCPAFVNTHCHLELSHLKDKVKQKTGLKKFIQDLQSARNSSEEQVHSAIEKGNKEMLDNGIIAVGDISNGSSSFATKGSSSIFYHSFIELFGFDSAIALEVYKRGVHLKELAEKFNLSVSIAPHSPYSVSTLLFELITSGNENCLSIHNQESVSENELYQNGSGQLAEMLKDFGHDINHFNVSGKNSLPSYLKLFNKTTPLLLVHNTYTTSQDIKDAEMIHKNLFWCFCPKANLYIEGQIPDIYAFIDEKVKCTLGTDSLASNDTLSIWEEIKTIKKYYQNIDLDMLIKWGTINGAEFLGLQNDYGSLEVGKKGKINWIKNLDELETSSIMPIL